jgi:hypothetical protein
MFSVARLPVAFGAKALAYQVFRVLWKCARSRTLPSIVLPPRALIPATSSRTRAGTPTPIVSAIATSSYPAARQHRGLVLPPVSWADLDDLHLNRHGPAFPPGSRDASRPGHQPAAP